MSPLLLLSGCFGPSMDGYITMGRLVTIENTSSSSFEIRRVVANDSWDNAGCNQYPGAVVAPGRSYTTRFLLCGTVTRFTVVTNKGNTTLTRVLDTPR